MIFGIGIDIAGIREFGRILADPATHFLGAHFTAGELAYARAQESDDPARHLAARYAAKEAAIKAVQGSVFDVRCSGFEPRTSNLEQKIDFREIEVMSQKRGAPVLRFHGAMAEAIRQSGVRKAHLSLSHDGDLAVAMVVLEK